MNPARQVLTVFKKDLRAELRSKEAVNASFSFAVVILLMFSFAFEPSEEETRTVAGGLLWIVFAFAGALILNRSFVRELPNDCLDALIAAPLPGWALFLGKALASFVLLMAIELVCLPIFSIFYNISITDQFWPLILVLVLGTWALTVVGTSFSALTVNIRLREVMLPLLIYPIMMPALIAAMLLSGGLLEGQGFTGNNAAWLQLLVGFNIIFTALAVTLIEFVLVI